MKMNSTELDHLLRDAERGYEEKDHPPDLIDEEEHKHAEYVRQRTEEQNPDCRVSIIAGEIIIEKISK